QEKANLAAVKAKRADLEVQLESARGRPAEIPTQLAVSKQAREDLESEQKLPAPANELAWKTEARRWSQSTRIAALRAEITMLDQELLALPFRIELLEVQRDQQVNSAERITVRTKLITELSGRQGRKDARAAKIAAEAAVDDAAGKHPLIRQLAEQNAELTRDITAMTTTLKESSLSYESIDRDARRIDDDFRRAREQLEVAGLSDVLGELLRHQRQSLPEPGKLRRQQKELEGKNARVSLELIQQGVELKRLRNPEGYIVELSRGLSASEVGQINNDLLELANSRRDLLDKSISLHKSYVRSLTELAASYRHLLDASTGYDVFLAENLLWIRSAPPPGLNIITDIPSQFIWLFSPSRWLEVPGALIAGVLNSLPVKILLLLFVALVWKTRYLHRELIATGDPVGTLATDRFSYTARALGLTLLLASTWPLLVALTGWALVSGPDVGQFPVQVSDALLQVAPTFFYIQFFSVLCLPGGVADKHFRWPVGLPRSLYREFYRFKIMLLPAIFVVILAVEDDQVGALDSEERLFMMAALMIVALFFYRLSRLLIKHSISSMLRQRYFWLTLTVAAPLLLAVLAFLGYFYTAGTLGKGLIQTLWIAFGLVVLHQIVVRWLLLTQRRLALQAARDRLQAAREEKESGDAELEGVSVQVEEPEIDLVALNEESRKLLSMVLVIVGFFGFWLVWSDILPALNVLDDVTLWHKPGIVAGEEAIVPVSLGDLGVALLIGFLTWLAMKRLPPLLEIVLLQRVNMTSGSRYTARTLTTYAIVGIGLIAFFNVIGMDWSKVQWLFAALSVSSGFGL
ncbi:MAG TPA: hypothetical protein ENG26_00280, partial [Gammaproteobacteria bacterium]|nr:hypothetical protein [Gammaproteobacteria bacterium]